MTSTATSTVTLALSVDSIAREIYAASALRTLLSSDSPSTPAPPVLSRDSRPALEILIRDAYCRVALMLAGHVESLDDNYLGTLGDGREPLPVTGDTILSLVLRVPRSWPSGSCATLCAAVTHAIAMTALDVAFTGCDIAVSSRYSTLASQSVESVSTMLCGLTPPSRLTRHLL
ncbi:MAG: hypothetical protein NC117_00650 [Pseudoflavonifractor sp.]|nr:hypothetical protein [Pseudoflavonifractor sp.]